MSEPADLDLLYEGRGTVAIAKPPGEPVIAARLEPPDACVHRRLERQLGRRLWIVHRLDRDTSGVVLFALDAGTHRTLSLAFEERRVSKTYRVFVHGSPDPVSARIDLPLHAARKGKARPARPGEPGAQAAVTDYRTLRSWRVADALVSLVEAQPQSGRHHQIRVHLRSKETPVLFDPLYGKGFGPAALEEAPCRRLALHALRIELPAPDGTGRLAVEAPLPADLAALEGWLDEQDPSHGARA